MGDSPFSFEKILPMNTDLRLREGTAQLENALNKVATGTVQNVILEEENVIIKVSAWDGKNCVFPNQQPSG